MWQVTQEKEWALCLGPDLKSIIDDAQKEIPQSQRRARILEWLTVSFSMGLPNPEIKPRSPALHADSLLSEPPGKPT